MKCNWEKVKSYSWFLHINTHTYIPNKYIYISMAREHGLNCSIVTRLLHEVARRKDIIFSMLNQLENCGFSGLLYSVTVSTLRNLQ